MVLKAQLVYPTDNVFALSLINQAAQEGHPASVRYLSDKKNRDISVTAFLKQYVFEGD